MPQKTGRASMRARTARGFSLIEVMASLALVAAVLAAYGAVIYASVAANDGAQEETALHIAANRLEQLRAGGYDALPATGAFTDPDMSELPDGAGTTTVSDYNSTTKEVAVEVSWASPRGTRSESLTTLISKTGGLK